MSAYVVAHFTIHDEEAYGRYVQAFFPHFATYNGELLAFDDNQPILEGGAPEGRTVVLRFVDMNTAKAWYNDPEYQKIAEDRKAGTKPYLITLINDRPEGWVRPAGRSRPPPLADENAGLSAEDTELGP